MTQSVIQKAALGEFFRDEVSQARNTLGIELSDLTEYYVVNLLCDYSGRNDAVPKPGDEPLALLYKRALESPPDTRIQLFKNLGDVALYVSGFFADFVERSLVDIDYYISMGGNAYNSLSGLVVAQRNGETFAEVYTQLAKKFAELVDLLAQIAERSNLQGNGDGELLKLYDRWARTGSERIHKKLIEKGLVPTEGLPTEYNQ